MIFVTLHLVSVWLLVSGIYADHIWKKLGQKIGQENLYPELRLKASFPSFVLIPAGYLIYGWTAEKTVGLYGPLIGIAIYAIGQMLAYTPSSIYLVDSKPGRSASAFAIQNCVQLICGAITTIVSSDCLHAVGNGVLFIILAAVSLANIIPVVSVLVLGRKWRTDFENKTNTGPQQRKVITPESTEEEKEEPIGEQLAIVHSRMSIVKIII